MRNRMAVGVIDRRGAVMLWVVGGLGALLTMTALTIDIGVVVLGKQQLQNATDAAALAAAARLQSGMDEDAARQAVIETAAANNFLSGSVTLQPQDVEIGGWDADNQEVVPWSPTFTSLAVSVTARATTDGPNDPVPMTFASVVGIQPTELTTSAVAGVQVNDGVRKEIELAMVQDASGSFEQEWTEAIEADQALVNMVNDVSVDGDHTSFVAFDEDISETYEWHWWWWYGWYRTYEDLTCNLTEFNHGEDQPLPSDVEDIYDEAEDHYPDGWTNPGKALEWALDDIVANGNSDSKQVIVVVSDGMPFGPDEDTTQAYRDYAVEQADRAGSLGVRIHTVTLTAEEHGEYGSGGADFEFNASLCRNGGYAFRTADPQKLMNLLITVGDIELGGPHLMM